jgi:type I restriction enzyme S subunit
MVVKKGYKQTEVGVIPEDWYTSPLGECGVVVMGQSPPGYTYNRNEQGVALINGPTEFTNKYPTKIQWTSAPARFCRVFDLLICVRGSSTGRTNLADDNYAIGRGVAAIRASSNNSTFYLSSQVVLAVKAILASTTGSTFPSIDGNSLRKILIHLPPTLAEQEAIAGALSDADAWIESLEQLIAKKRQIKQGAMQELLTGKRRLPGFSGRWQEATLGEICTKIQDGTHFSPKLGGSDYLYLTSKNIRFGVLDLSTAERISANEHAKIYSRCDVRKGDLLLTKDGANTGNAAINTLEEPFSLLSSVALVRFDERVFCTRFFLYQLLSKDGQQQIKELMSGNAITRLTLQKIRTIECYYPQIQEQTAIATVLSDMDTEIGSLESKLAKAREIKQGMMQELLTGKIRLV